MRFTIVFVFFLIKILPAQIPFIVIDSINLSGNTRTNDYIILNELDFSEGDTLAFDKLDKIFFGNKYRLLSTGLFVNVNFNLKKYDSNTGKGTISIKLSESWYIYPTVYFQLTDRNFNEWFYEHNADLNRINIVLELRHNNLTGNRDLTKLKFQRGVTKKWELEYKRPYLSKNCRIGFMFNAMYKYSKEIAYATQNNKLVFYHHDSKNMFKQLKISSGLTYRPKLFWTHTMEFNFYKNKIDTLIFNNFNPDYFYKNPIQKYFEIKYSAFYDKRKYKIYPKGGFLFGITVEKSGIGIYKDLDILNLYFSLEKYFPIGKRFLSTYKIYLKKNILNLKKTYFNNKSLGYEEDYINGYELYVIDGKDYYTLKTAQKYRLLSGILNLEKHINIGQFKKIPYEFYISFNFDLGYVNNNINFVSNNFTNRMLFGYGPGLDMIIYQRFFQINYSINHKGEGGIFFHYKNKF